MVITWPLHGFGPSPMAGHPSLFGLNFHFIFFQAQLMVCRSRKFTELIYKVPILPLTFLNNSTSIFPLTSHAHQVRSKGNLNSYKSKSFPMFPNTHKMRGITSSPPLEHSSSNVQLTLWGLIILRGGLLLPFKISSTVTIVVPLYVLAFFQSPNIVAIFSCTGLLQIF